MTESGIHFKVGDKVKAPKNLNMSDWLDEAKLDYGKIYTITSVYSFSDPNVYYLKEISDVGYFREELEQVNLSWKEIFKRKNGTN